MSIFSKIKEWLTGGSKSKSTTKRASRVTNYGGGGSRSVSQYSSTVRNRQKEEEDEEKRRRQLQKQLQEKRTKELASISKNTDALSSGKKPQVTPKLTPPTSTRQTGQNRVIKKIEEKSKNATPDPKTTIKKTSAKEALEKLDSIAKDAETKLNKVDTVVKNFDKKNAEKRESFNKVTGDKYNVEKNGLEARQAMKSRAYDPEEEKWALKNDPTVTSAARGLTSTLTLGGSELLAQTSKNRKESGAEEFYQKNKNSVAEIVGEVAGSFATFGLTSGASAKVANSIARKVAPKLMTEGVESAAKYLASTSAFKAAAKKEAMQVAKRGGLKMLDDAVIERYALDRAKRLLGAIGTDIAINNTTGRIMDVNYSALNSDNLGEFGKNMATSAGLNFLLGGGLTVAPALRTTKGIFKRTARDEAVELAKRINAEDALRNSFFDGIGQANEVMNGLKGGVARNADDVAEVAAEDAKRAVEAEQRNIQEEAAEAVKRDFEAEAPKANELDAQVNDTIDELIESATTAEDFMDLGLPRGIAEILAEDRTSRKAGAEVVNAIDEAAHKGIPRGNIKPLAESLRTNEFLPRPEMAQYYKAPRSVKRVDTSVDGLTKQLDELKGQTGKTEREKRAIESKISDVEDRLNRAKWRQEGGADMDAMHKAYRGEYEGFDMSKTTNSYQSDALEGKLKGKTATIVEMSPDEYIERTYRQIFKKPSEKASAFSRLSETQKNVEQYAEAMRNGDKFPLPYLDYTNAGQEGRHRALAAKMAGIDRIPVVIIDSESNPKAIIDEVAEATAKATETPRVEVEPPKAEAEAPRVEAEPPRAETEAPKAEVEPEVPKTDESDEMREYAKHFAAENARVDEFLSPKGFDSNGYKSIEMSNGQIIERLDRKAARKWLKNWKSGDTLGSDTVLSITYKDGTSVYLSEGDDLSKIKLNNIDYFIEENGNTTVFFGDGNINLHNYGQTYFDDWDGMDDWRVDGFSREEAEEIEASKKYWNDILEGSSKSDNAEAPSIKTEAEAPKAENIETPKTAETETVKPKTELPETKTKAKPPATNVETPDTKVEVPNNKVETKVEVEPKAGQSKVNEPKTELPNQEAKFVEPHSKTQAEPNAEPDALYAELKKDFPGTDEQFATLREEHERLTKEYQEALAKGDNDAMWRIGGEQEQTEIALGMRDAKGTYKDKYKGGKLANKAETQATETVKPKADAETNGRTTAKQKAVDEKKETEAIARDLRENRKKINDELQKATEGKLGYREGHSFAAILSDNDEEIQRLGKEVLSARDSIARQTVDLDELAKNNAVYKKQGKNYRDEKGEAAFAAVANDPVKAAERLLAKLEAGETLSIETDLTQAIALDKFYKAAGIEMPESFRTISSRVIAETGTQGGQLMAFRQHFLKENSSVWKKRLLNKDLEVFRKRVCHVADDADWKKMSEHLDEYISRQTGKPVTGYLDKEIERLSQMTGAENEEAFRKAYQKLQNDIFRNTEPTVMEVLSLIRHTFMLSSLKTGLNNIIGNISQLSMYRMSDFMQVMMENKIAKTAAAKGADYHKKTAFLKNKELKKLAGWSSIQNGIVGEKAAAKNTGETEFSKLFNEKVHDAVRKAMGDSKYGFKAEKGADIVYDNALKNFAMKATRKGSQAVGIMLNEPDSWFVEHSYRLSFAKYLEANGITTAKAFADNEALIREASDYALDVALENTYKKANRLVNVLEGARTRGYAKGSSLGQKAIAIGLDAELPYLKVPVNLVINNFKYSPMGLIKNGASAMTALRKGNVEAFDRACREMTKGLTGTGMAIVGFLLACDDQAGDEDWGFISKAAEELKEYGVRDNSFKIGNKNLSVANMGIGSVQFLMGARFGEELNEMGGCPSSFLDSAELVTSVFSANFNAIADMSLLDNAFAIADAFSSKGDYTKDPSEIIGNVGFEIAGNYAGQFVPSPLRALARSMTSSDLDTGVKKGDSGQVSRQLQRTKNNLVSGIPIANEIALPHKVDRHGNLVNGRDTAGKKLKQFAINYADPFSTKTVNIPKADKEEMKVTDESGKPYQPAAFDEDRTYQAKIGSGEHAEIIDLTGKEREQASRSVKSSGYDSAYNVVAAGYFGDTHGTRAKEILENIPDDEEKAREYIFATEEYKKLNNEEKREFLDDWYDKADGRGRTANHEVYVNIKGGDEGDFRFQNDLAWQDQDKYTENKLESEGITKGQWADIIEATKYEHHKYQDGKNTDTINSTTKTKAALLALDLTPEQRVAAFEAIRGGRNWKDWDGVTPGRSYSGYRGRGRRYYRWGRGGRSSGKARVPAPKKIGKTALVKGKALVSTNSTASGSKASLPTLERVKAKIDLPTAKW